jgi:FHA domain
MIRRIDRATEYFTKALAISPRTPVQKELGWINLEQGRLPTAISLLTDHLQRNASDYESYNLLLKCFYLTDRFEAGESLARTMIDEKAPNECFWNNEFLCRLLSGKITPAAIGRLPSRKTENPFIAYNVAVTMELPSSWVDGEQPSLKSKLLFEEYAFGIANRATKTNTLAVYMPDEARRDFKQPIVTIGSLATNDIVLKDGSVSRRHCAIVNYPDNVWLYDFESTVGTVVDGERLVGRILLDGVHKVQVGRVGIRIASSSDRLL